MTKFAYYKRSEVEPDKTFKLNILIYDAKQQYVHKDTAHAETHT